MRGETPTQTTILFPLNIEARIPATHPLRRIKQHADAMLAAMSPRFDAMYSRTGRPSIPPERLLKAHVLMALFTIRSERRLCEELEFNFLYRWFLDMHADEPVWDSSTFTYARERLFAHEIAREFLSTSAEYAKDNDLASDEHFSVDGTLIEAWASMKSFRKKDDDHTEPPTGGRNEWVDFSGETRANDTHESTTDPDAKLVRKGDGREARLSFAAHALMDNRHGLVRDFWVTSAVGISESEAALAMLDGAGIRGKIGKSISVGADKGYDTHAFVNGCRERGITPHVARRKRGTVLDDETAATAGYAMSQRIRKTIEEIFGWVKTTGNFRKTRLRGIDKVQMAGYLVATAYNILRIARLLAARELDTGPPGIPAAAQIPVAA